MNVVSRPWPRVVASHRDPEVVAAEEVEYQFSGSEVLSVSTVSPEVMTRETDVICLLDYVAHSLHREPLATLDVNLQKIDTAKAVFPTDLVE